MGVDNGVNRSSQQMGYWSVVWLSGVYSSACPSKFVRSEFHQVTAIIRIARSCLHEMAQQPCCKDQHLYGPDKCFLLLPSKLPERITWTLVTHRSGPNSATLPPQVQHLRFRDP